MQELKELQESTLELNEGQQKELDTRLEKYTNGEMVFSSWDLVKERVIKAPLKTP